MPIVMLEKHQIKPIPGKPFQLIKTLSATPTTSITHLLDYTLVSQKYLIMDMPLAMDAVKWV
jgi:hypothetical protein